MDSGEAFQLFAGTLSSFLHSWLVLVKSKGSGLFDFRNQRGQAYLIYFCHGNDIKEA